MLRFCVIFVIATTFLLFPAVAHTQSTDNPVTIGLLIYNPQPFIDEMTRLGYVEGEDVTYITLSFENVAPEDFAERQQLQTQAMLDLPVDILIALNDSSAVQLRTLNSDIPIIFLISDDPVATGAVADLTIPGGNTTGVVSNQHHLRRLQLLTEINPETDKVYYFYFPGTLESQTILSQVVDLGQELGVEVIDVPVPDPATGVASLENIPEGVDWFFITPYVPLDQTFSEALFATSLELQAPVANFFALPFPGYLVSYGADLDNAAQQSAQLADLILRGADPGELPVLIADNGLVINLEVAALYDIEIPVSILRQADVIVRPEDDASESGN